MTSTNHHFNSLFADIQNAKLAANAIQARAHSMNTTNDDLRNKITSLKSQYNSLNAEIEALEIEKEAKMMTQQLQRKQHQQITAPIAVAHINSRLQTSCVDDCAQPISDDESIITHSSTASSHSNQLPRAAKGTPRKQKKEKKSGKQSFSKRRHSSSPPKKWRRMIRSKRLQSILLA